MNTCRTWYKMHQAKLDRQLTEVCLRLRGLDLMRFTDPVRGLRLVDRVHDDLLVLKQYVPFSAFVFYAHLIEYAPEDVLIGFIRAMSQELATEDMLWAIIRMVGRNDARVTEQCVASKLVSAPAIAAICLLRADNPDKAAGLKKRMAQISCFGKCAECSHTTAGLHVVFLALSRRPMVV
jgi:hypothetical protein